jgi:hypothetical protein
MNAHAVHAQDFQSVFLVDNAGAKTHIANVEFSQNGERKDYKVVWNDSAFDDYFLSMRPFKCVPNAKKLWCRVPYPYEIKRELIDNDTTDLEYDFLFVWKNANDYGIDMWNGVYYDLTADGAGFVGQMNAFDLGRLAVPPPKGELRPIKSDFLDEADPTSHLFPNLLIE